MSNLKDATIYYRDLKLKIIENRKKIRGPALSKQLINWTFVFLIINKIYFNKENSKLVFGIKCFMVAYITFRNIILKT